MDLTIPVIMSIAALGYKFSQGTKSPRDPVTQRTTVSEHDIPSAKNVYNSTFVKTANDIEQKLADTNYKMSQNPVATNVIPQFYNSIGAPVASDNLVVPGTAVNAFQGSSTVSTLYPKDQVSVLGSVQPTTSLDSSLRETRIFDGPMFNNSALPGLETVAGISGIISESDASVNNVSTLSGLPTDNTHQNMVPFFGSKVTQNTNANANNSLVERFTGAEQPGGHKKEVANMFKPTPQNVFGSSVYQVDADRFVTSNLKTNLLPTPQVRVQPIPSDLVRPVHKTVDQLRSLSNQKETYAGKQLQGVRPSEMQRGNLGVQNKNTPDSFYINDRNLPTMAANTKPRQQQNYDIQDNSRADITSTQFNLGPQKSENLASTLQYVKNSNGGLNPIVQDDNNNTLTNDYLRNGVPLDNKIDPNDRNKYVARPNDRDTQRTDLANATFDVKKGWIFNDTAKTTVKETNLFDYSGNAESQVPAAQDYTANYNQQRDRQWLSVENYIGVPNGQNKQASYEEYNNVRSSDSRELLSKNRTPNGQLGLVPSGKASINVRNKNMPNPVRLENKTFKTVIPTKSEYNFTKDVSRPNDIDTTARIDPSLLNAFKTNPYTQSLSSI